jgi:hypothetical protein
VSAEALHVLDGDAQKLHGLVRPGHLHELDERHHVLAVSALGVARLPPGDRRFKNIRDQGKNCSTRWRIAGVALPIKMAGRFGGSFFGASLV